MFDGNGSHTRAHEDGENVRGQNGGNSGSSKEKAGGFPRTRLKLMTRCSTSTLTSERSVSWLNVCVLPVLYVEALVLHVMMSGRWWGRQRGFLMMGLVPLQAGNQTAWFLSLYVHGGKGLGGLSWKVLPASQDKSPARKQVGWHLHLELLPSRTTGKDISLSFKLPRLWNRVSHKFHSSFSWRSYRKPQRTSLAFPTFCYGPGSRLMQSD